MSMKGNKFTLKNSEALFLHQTKKKNKALKIQKKVNELKTCWNVNNVTALGEGVTETHQQSTHDVLCPAQSHVTITQRTTNK